MSNPSDLFDPSNTRVRVARLPAPEALPERARRRAPRWILWATIGAVVVASAAGAVAFAAISGSRGDVEAREAAYSEAQEQTTHVEAAFTAERAEIVARISSDAENADRLTVALAAARGYVDDAALDAAEGAVRAYADALSALSLPQPVDALLADIVNPETESEYSQAVAALEDARREIRERDGALEAVRDQLTTLEADLDAELKAFRESLPPRAVTLAEENPDALEEFRVAVADSAQAVVEAADTAALETTLAGFAVAVDALRADQQRAAEAIELERLEQERREAEERERQQSPQVPVPVPVPEPSPEPEPEATPEPTPLPEEPAPETPAPEEPAPETPAPEEPRPQTPAPDAE